MKIVRNYLFISSLLILAVLSNCGKKGGETNEESIQMKRLTGTWNVSVARNEDVLQSGYENCKITLSGSAKDEVFEYSISGAPTISPWTGVGTWKFGSNIETQIIRDPNTANEVEMDYVVSESALQLSFQYEVGTARTESANGYWIFTFTKQ